MEESQMQDKTLNEKESLALIAKMIQNTQQRLERGAGAPMLVWGYTTVITTIAIWIAFRISGNYNWNYFWFLIPIVGVPYSLLKKRQPKEVNTYVDKVLGYIWIVLGSTGFLLSSLSIFSVMWSLPILFIIILIMAMGSILTGLVTEFRISVVGGIIAMLIGSAHYLIDSYDIKMWTFAFAFVAMDVVPGHILNYRAKTQCSKN
jgi:hypothetical protein